MAGTPSMPGRFLTFDVDGIADDVLKIDEIRANEAISACTPFRVLLSARAAKLRDVNSLSLVGKMATASLALDDDNYRSAPRRFFSGIIRSFTHLNREGVLIGTGADARNAEIDTFEVELVPPMWLLTQRRNCKIYSGTVVEIIREVCAAASVEVDTASSGSEFESREYCVQYRESDFQFLSRLMEEEGLTYFFQHEWLACKLVVVDSKSVVLSSVFDEANAQASNTSAIPDQVVWNAPHGGIYRWFRRQKLTSTQRKTRDFHFDESSPIKSFEENAISFHPYQSQADRLVSYDYPGGMAYSAKRDLNVIAMEAMDAQIVRVEAESRNWYLQPYRTFTLSGYFDDDQNVSHVVESVEHVARQSPPNWVRDHGEGDPPALYENRFQCFPETYNSQPIWFRAPQTTPRPIVEGPQTATVVSDAPADLHSAGASQKVESDSFGRVKVRFHWDEVSDQVLSCWVRVSQAWAGSGYGSYLLPHLGQEVVVSFLEGNPDRPLIVGRVYNQNNKPFYYDRDEVNECADPTANSHIAVVARDQIYNEINLDSTEGKENVLLRSPGKNSYIRVGGVDGIVVKTGGGITELFEGWDIRYTYANSWYLTVGVAANAQFGGALDLMVGGAFDLALATKVDVSVGFELSASMAGKFNWSAGTSYEYSREASLHESEDDVETKANKCIVQDARDTLTLVGGPDPGVNGRIEASGDGIVLSCGTGNVADAGKAGWAVALGTYTSAFAGLVSGAAPAIGASKAVKDNPPSDQELLNDHDKAYLWGSAATAIAGSVTAIGILAATARAARVRVRGKAKQHQLSYSKLELLNGQAKMQSGIPGAEAYFDASNGNCEITSSVKNVRVNGTAGVMIESPATVRIQGNVISLNKAVTVLP